MAARQHRTERRVSRQRARAAATGLLLLSLPLLGGCAAPFAAGVGISEFISIASLTGTVAFNKGATDLALDFVTGDDCRVMEGMVREDRNICESIGSAATDRDFKGVVGEVQDGDLIVVGHRRMELHDGAEVTMAVYGIRPDPKIVGEL
ncbi:MAG: hypothetical protein RIC83_05840 [Alphaproteobacteria bacterium]